MTQLLEQTVNGLVLGSFLALMSLGLTLIFGLGRIVNLAHGALFSLGALVMYQLCANGVPFLVALVVVMISAAALGAFVDVAFITWIRNRPELQTLLLTFGVGLVLTGLMQRMWGADPRDVAAPGFARSPIEIFGLNLSSYRLLGGLLAVAASVALLVVLRRSPWGLRIRAINDEPDMGVSLGINRRALMLSVFAVGSAFAALAGALSAPIQSASPIIGDTMLIQAFLIVVIGGLGSVRGSLIAAYIVGIATALGEAYIGGYLAQLVLFCAVIAVLSVRPRGILGEGRLV